MRLICCIASVVSSIAFALPQPPWESHPEVKCQGETLQEARLDCRSQIANLAQEADEGVYLSQSKFNISHYAGIARMMAFQSP